MNTSPVPTKLYGFIAGKKLIESINSFRTVGDVLTVDRYCRNGRKGVHRLILLADLLDDIEINRKEPDF